MIFYHGGGSGYKKILPPNQTGVLSCSDCIEYQEHNKNKCYVTTDYNQALIFAAFHPSGKGRVYEVIPCGDLSYDGDYLAKDGSSIECDYAEIVRVIKPKRKMLEKIRKTILEYEGIYQ